MTTRDGWPRYSPACRQAVQRLLRNGTSLTAYRSNPGQPVGPAKGSWAWKFERLAERQAKVNHVIACSSGTMALVAGLRALDTMARVGHTAITSPFTFSATASALDQTGHGIAFADVGLEPVGCLDPHAVAQMDGDFVVPVDLFGAVADRRNGLPCRPILADSCQAVGAYTGMRQAQIAVWSMNGQKNVPAGEAGAVLTDDDDLAIRIRRYLSHGENWGDLNTGINGRLNELTACVAYHGLVDLPRHNARRRRLAVELWRQLKDEDRLQGLLTPQQLQHHALYVYPFRVSDRVDRARFVSNLRKLGVEAGEGYIRPPLHKYPAFAAYATTPLPVVEDLSERSLVLLYHVRPPATVAQMRWTARAIRLALDALPIPRRASRVIATVDAEAF